MAKLYTKLTPRKPLLLWCMGVFFLSLIIAYSSPDLLFNRFKSVDPVWIGYSFFFLLSGFFIGAVNSFIIVSINEKVTFFQYLWVYWISWAVGLFFPGQIADIGVISILLKKQGVIWTNSLGKIVLDKVISLGVTIVLAFLAVVVLLYDTGMAGEIIASLAFVVVFAFTFAYLLDFNRLKSKYKIIASITSVFSISLDTVKEHPKKVLVNLLLTVIKIALFSLSFWCTFKSLGADLDFWHLVLLMSMGSLVAYLPLSINGVGTVEITGVFLFSQIGVASDLTLSAYLISRLIVIASAWCPTFFMFTKFVLFSKIKV